MSLRYPGGLITKTPTAPTISSAPGIWTMEQALEYIKAGTWPLPPQPDPYFEYVTMLLHGDGTNGAQNNTFLDSSANTFTITRNGNTTQGTFTPYGSLWSNYFDGTGDSLSGIGTTSSFNFLHNTTALFTVEAWVYVTTAASQQVIIDNNGGATSNVGISFFINNTSNQLRLMILRGGAGTTVIDNTFTTTAVPFNSWAHIALTYDQSLASDNAKLYINGVAAGTATKTGQTPSGSNASSALRVGEFAVFGGGYINGYVSNLRITNSIVYTSAFTPPTSPLTAIANTSLLTCQSNRFIDNSSNTFAITVNGNTSVQRFSPFSPTLAYSTSTIGGSGYFDGSGDYLSIANNAAFQVGTGDFSLEGWFYTTSTAVQAPFGTLYSGTTNYLLTTINRNSGGSNVSGFVQGGIEDSGLLTSSTAVFNINQWNHLVLCRSGTTLSIFVNGSRVATSTNSSASNSTQAFQIGDNTGLTRPFFGYISSVRLVKGSSPYDATQTSLSVPTAPPTAITNTSFLGSFTNAGIFDNAMMNDLETVGNAQISTSVKKFGTGSLAFDGTDDYVVSPARTSFEVGTGDYTLEFWVYWNVVGNIAMLFGWNGGASGSTFAYTYSDGRIGLGINGTNEIVSTSGQATTGSWIHMAFVKNGSTTTIYKNGTSIASSTTAVWSSNTGTTVFSVGGGASASDTNCYIDDFRITKGYARYTTNFTPPTAAFPNL